MKNLIAGLPGSASGSAARFANAAVRPQRLLLGVAEYSGIGDLESCRTILSILAASRAIRRNLGHDLENQEVSEWEFVPLVTLYAMEPQAATVADLALHAQMSWTMMHSVIGDLDRRGLVARGGEAADRHAPVHLTEPGCRVTVLAVHRFLQMASELAGAMGATSRAATIKACEQIGRRTSGPSFSALFPATP